MMLALERMYAEQQRSYERAEAMHYNRMIREAEGEDYPEVEEEPAQPDRTSVMAGLIRGDRHAPVCKYIWDGLADLTDLIAIEEHAQKWVEKNCNVCQEHGSSLSCVNSEYVSVYRGSPLILYAEGPVICVAAVIAACARCGVPLTLMHYDAAINEYMPQEIFFEEDFL